MAHGDADLFRRRTRASGIGRPFRHRGGEAPGLLFRARRPALRTAADAHRQARFEADAATSVSPKPRTLAAALWTRRGGR